MLVHLSVIFVSRDSSDSTYDLQNRYNVVLSPFQSEHRGSWMVRKDRGIARRIDDEALGFEQGFERSVDVPPRRKTYQRDQAFNRHIPENIGNSNRVQENMGWFESLTTQGILSRLFGYSLAKLPNSYRHRYEALSCLFITPAS